MSRDSERPHLRDSYKLLTTAARLIQRRQEQALAPLGLTRAAVIALEAVASRPMNQEQLAAKVHVQGQTLGRVLARLESQGLVTRTRNAADRRQLQVKLTPAGKTALNAARQAEVDAFPVARDDDGWDALQEQLTKFIASFQAPQPVEQAPARSTDPLLESTPELALAPASQPGQGAQHALVDPGDEPRTGATSDAERVPTPPGTGPAGRDHWTVPTVTDRTRTVRKASVRRRISRAFGTGFAGVFRTIKAVRPDRPIHPQGVRLAGTLERHGSASGAAWVDTAGTDPVTARLSRSLGLPGRFPDMLGLALRFANDGTPSDVLLASTGASRAGRFALTLRRNAAAGVFSSLMPYKTASGPLLLAARTVSAPRRLRAEPETFRVRPRPERLDTGPLPRPPDGALGPVRNAHPWSRRRPRHRPNGSTRC